MPDIPLHIIQRGNNRVPCFGCDSDYLAYLDMLGECALDCGCAIHAYVLMTNHVHLLLSPDDVDSPSIMMQRLGRRYVRYFNHRHHRTGTLWEGRFRSCLVLDAEYLLTCYRYIELNPVRARMVASPRDYPWSSYRTNALGYPDQIVKPHRVYTGMGEDAQTRQAAYNRMFDDALSDETLEQIRSASNGNRALGEQGRE